MRERTEKQCYSLNRRNFLRIAGCAGAGLAVSSCYPPGISPDIPCDEVPILTGYQPIVSSAWIPKGEHKNSYHLFKQTIEAATDFSWLSSGDSVFIKLALLADVPFPASTDPWALDCMIRLLKEKGAGEVVAGDQCGVEHVINTENYSKGSSREICKKVKLLNVIDENNAGSLFFEEDGYDGYLETYPSGPHNWERPIYIPKAIEQFDHIVYIPRVSSHLLSDVTTGLKIAMGFLREDSRLAIHQGGDDFCAMYTQIHDVPEIKDRLRLVVTSGREVQSTLGPIIGHVSKPDHGLIFASEDLLANELLGYSWLKWNYDYETPFLSKLMGMVAVSRSALNLILSEIIMAGIEPRNPKTPAIPMTNTKNIYCHSAVTDFMERKGGSPENLHWEQINQNPDTRVTDYLKNEMKITG